MKQHTPEPWSVSYCEDSCSIYAADGEILTCCRTFDEYNEENDLPRIIECVNACSGIEDPETTIPELVEACRNLCAWWDGEHAGPNYGSQNRDTHPDGEAIWNEWWNRNQMLCSTTHELVRAVLAKVKKG